MINNIISIRHDIESCYFHVLGDNKKYLDIDALLAAHEELKSIIVNDKYELNRELYRLREITGLNNI